MTDGSFAQGLIGVTLDGRYRLEAVLGEGGMGSVFRATQLAMERKVAVKLLKPHLTSDEQALQRFAREARATMKVDSPHAVKVLDFGVTPLRDYYMVLEYLDGRTVQRELEIDGAFAPARVAHIARQALHALGAAHDQGLIHRDVKPDNLLLMRVGADTDYTKILDFGVAKLLQGSAGDPHQLALTAAGMVFGTPEFMSPEQACGQTVDGRSDLYSLAATMFLMLTGQTMFEANKPIEWLTHHARTPAPRLAMVRPELAAYPELDDLMQRCLAKKREQRPATAAELARLLADLAPTLLRTPATTLRPPTTKPNAIRASSFVPALRDTAPGPALAEPAPPLTSMPTSPASASDARPPSRRGVYLALGAAMIVALIGVAVWASGRAGSRSTSISTSTTGSSTAASNGAGSSGAGPNGAGSNAAAPNSAGSTGAAPHGAGSTGAAPNGAGSSGAASNGAGSTAAGSTGAAPTGAAPRSNPAPPSSDTAQIPAPTPGVRDPRAAAKARAAAAAEHLRAAEAATNPLTQLIQANLALEANPRSVAAAYLAGDALLKSGDMPHGCERLRAIKANARAAKRMREAGCTGD